MLTLQFIPQIEIQGLSSEQRVNKLLKLVKSENVILLEGRLKSKEEADLIQVTMEAIDKEFKGIEIGTIMPKKINKFKQSLMKFIFHEEKGFTIIGPATVIKEIKQNPGKIQLFMSEGDKKKTSSSKKKKRKK